MTEKRFSTNGYKIYDTFHDGLHWLVNEVEADEIVEVMNNLDNKARERSKALSKLQKENEELKQQLNDCTKTKRKRLRRMRHQRAVLEEMGAVNIGYKGELKELHHKINKIKEAMEDTGALTKRQLEEILE